ncbi:MAG: AAA family ATPase [Butyricicoccus sp.]
MDKQIILCIGREFGSGGHAIADRLAERYQLPLYDKNLLDHIEQEKNMDLDAFKRFDEKPKNPLFSRTVRGYSTSSEDNVAKMQFDFLKKKADEGESFIVVGRCGNSILKDYDGMISVFVTGNRENKTARLSQIYDLSIAEAEMMRIRTDKQRKTYHNHYCKEKWGDSRHYELIINTSRIGLEAAADVIAAYVDNWYHK